MKKTMLKVLLITFIIIGFTGQSWAFGSRHHHDDGQGSDNTGIGSGPSGNNFGNGGNSFGNNAQGNNPGGNGNNPGSNWGNPPSNNFPAAPVPEPMTLSLLGVGLAGIFLQRKNH